MDTDGDGCIDYDEFFSKFSRLNENASTENAEKTRKDSLNRPSISDKNALPGHEDVKVVDFNQEGSTPVVCVSYIQHSIIIYYLV